MKFPYLKIQNPTLIVILRYFFAIGGSLGICAILIFMIGANILECYGTLFEGAFGSLHGFAETLARATPLIIISLGLAVAFKCKFFNIGAPGQLYMGAISAGVVGLTFREMPAPLLLPLMMTAGFLGGAAWGAIPALLRIKFDAHEVIVTILLNYVALYFLYFLVEGPMKEPGEVYASWTPLLPPSGILPRLIPGTRFHAGFLIALPLVILIYVLFQKTILGYRIRAVGSSLKASNYAGISTSKILILAAIISGGIAGLAGMIELSGIFYRLEIGFTFYVGFTAIIIAWLGKNNPLLIGFMGFFFGGLFTGGSAMQAATGVPIYLTELIPIITIIFLVTSEFLIRRRT